MTAPDYDRDTDEVEALLDDPITRYLREIGQIKLLTAAQEVRLARAMRVGRAIAARIAETGDNRPALQRRVALGEAARKHLVQANLRLVVSIAKNYSGRGLSMEDLIQEGNIGLMRAVEEFDHTRGTRFSTYATWWIRQGVGRAVADKARAIRLPVHMTEALNKTRQVRSRLWCELEREPTDAEIARAMGKGRSAAWVARLWEYGRDVCSIDKPVNQAGHDQETDLGAFLADDAEPIEERACHATLQDDIRRILSKIADERARNVIKLRYGLEDGCHRTLEEVARVFGITRERIRQIEAGALRELGNQDELRGYLEGVGA